MANPINSLYIHPGTMYVGIGTQNPQEKLTVAGNICPATTLAYDLGTPNLRFRDLYLSGNSINLGGTILSRDGGTGGLRVLDQASGGAPLDMTVRNLIASNVSVIGDYVTLNTITSNTEQMVITNAGTGPGLKVTQTGANSIAEFYDDGGVLAMKIADGGNVGIGTATPMTKLDVAGILKATGLQINDITNAFMPRGGIIMWSGSIATIPTGWAICDGTNGTPDLRNKFIIGAGSSYAVAVSGGSTTKTLTEANMPAHTHSGTTAQDGNHRHYIRENGIAGTGSYAAPATVNGYTAYTDYAGLHTHTFTTDSKGSGTAFDIMPPYYALAYIMKL